MRSIFLSLIVFSAISACGSQESEGPATDNSATPASSAEMPDLAGLEIGPCCGGGCRTPEGYCCNENHCRGNCDETLPVWTFGPLP